MTKARVATGALRLPAGTGVGELAALLAPLGTLRAGPALRRRSTLLDTFDGRARRAGLVIEEVQAGRRLRVVARSGRGGRAAAARGPAPRFARDLPPGALRERLAPLCETRALLPVAVLETETVPLELRDRRGRLLARMRLESVRSAPPAGEPDRDLAAIVTPGVGRGAARVAALLAATPGVEVAAGEGACGAIEQLAPSPLPRPAAVADPDAPARDAAREVLLGLLGAIERNLPGARDDVDPEFLHDLRVAVRRSRSVLGQMKQVFPPGGAARFAGELRRIQELTGPARDLDVFVLELPALAALLPPRRRRSLGPLARLLERRRAAAHRELAAALASPGFARLLAAWRRFLELPTPRRPRGAPHALRPARDEAARRIRRLHRRAVAEGSAITDASPPGDLHELRKTCKKLRYLLELFGGLFDREEAREAVSTLKALQDDLGRHQDRQVQAAALARHARELAAEGRARPPAYLAIGMLIERLHEEQAAARREFAERFRPFASRRHRRRMHRLLAGRPPDVPLPPMTVPG